MNKRFSTLLAAALVAGGLSFNANAAVYGADDVKDGSFIHLGETSGSSDVLAVTEDGKFDQFTIAASNGWDGNIKNLLGTLWQVKKTAHTSSAGVQYTYSFVNRLSGQLLLSSWRLLMVQAVATSKLTKRMGRPIGLGIRLPVFIA